MSTDTDNDALRVGINPGGPFTDIVTGRNGVVHITMTGSTPKTSKQKMLNGLETALTEENSGTETDNGVRLVEKAIHNLAPRTVISVRTPDMGGYSDPEDQNPKAVVHNVQLENISPKTAHVAYSLTNPNLNDSNTKDVAREGSDPDRSV